MRSKLLFFCFFVSASVLGQDAPKLSFGVAAGANSGGISNLPSMLVPESFYTGYALKGTDYLFGFSGNVFLNYKIAHSPVSIQPEIGFSMHPGCVKYSDVNGLNYSVDFKYNFVNIAFAFKVYVWRYLHLSVIPEFGYNISGEKLLYSSNGEALYGPDLETQQLMRQVIRGRSDFSLGGGFGYEFHLKKAGALYVDARYYFGLSDVIETYSNSYHFAEVTNHTHSAQLTLGYAFGIK
jgi:hypothetical protein